MALSIPRRHSQAKAMPVSDNHTTWPAVPNGGTCRQRRGPDRRQNNAPNQTTATWPHWCGGHGRASRRGAEQSEALASRAAGPSGARNTRWATSNRAIRLACGDLVGGRATHKQRAPTDWRPPRGLRGLAGLRDDAPSKARRADGERAGRPRGGQKSVGATGNARHQTGPHSNTKPPGPTGDRAAHASGR